MAYQYINKHKPYGLYERFFKRILDFICGLLTLTLLCWLYAIVAILVRVKLGSPVLYKDKRPGKDEKIFTMYKFRTMTDDKDKDGNLLPDDQRLTKFGKMLRASSLDEIPCAINLINGTMSVVGPRPLLIRYLDRYNDRHRHRHDVRGGLTGWAQVHGRNLVKWNDKFEYDLEYIQKITFITDVKIVLKTIVVAFVKQEGITSKSSSTMEEFLGYDNEDSSKGK